MDIKLAAAVTGAVPSRQVSAFCEVHDISRQTFYKWRNRYLVGGLEGLVELSRRPARSPNRIDPAVEEAIVAARKQLAGAGVDAGPWSIVNELLRKGLTPPSEATIYRVLRSGGFITPEPRKKPRSSWRRFCWERPNDCWQIDATHVQLADATTVEVINIIDDHSRVLIASLAVVTCTSEQAWSAILAGFAQWGLPARLLSDNGLAFSGARRGVTVSFEANLTQLGVRTMTSTPYHPQTCGKVERFHQTLKKWLAARPLPATIPELQTLLDSFADYYNHHRPHRALQRRTPANVWHATPPARPEHTPATAAPTTITTLTVDTDGKARGQRYWWGIGTSHRHHTVTIIHDHTNAAIFHGDTLIATTNINPTRRYQRLTRHQPQ